MRACLPDRRTRRPGQPEESQGDCAREQVSCRPAPGISPFPIPASPPKPNEDFTLAETAIPQGQSEEGSGDIRKHSTGRKPQDFLNCELGRNRQQGAGICPSCLVKAMVFPEVMYECESWTIKKAECRRIDAFELWCWRRLLRVPWTARRSNQSIQKEISPEYSLEGMMLKVKLQHFGHLM